MRSNKVLLLAAVCWISLSSALWAQTSDEQADVEPEIAAGKIFRLHGSISGRTDGVTSGACAGGKLGFADQCATNDVCTCGVISGAKLSGNVIGRGRADIYLTVDNGQPGSPPPVCAPFVAEVDLIARNDTEELTGTGQICNIRKNDTRLSGTLTIASSLIFSTGFENFTATGNLNRKGAFRMRLKGQAKSD